jgi:threonine synthase
LNKKIAAKRKWYDRNTAYNPLTIEGKKSAAYDIFISTQGDIPENIIMPVGDGAILGGIYKGFVELVKLGWIERIPRLIAVQASGSNALERYIQNGKFEFKEAHTIADSLCAGAPRNLFMAASAIEESDGLVLSVEDEMITNAQKECAENLGFLLEPSAAITLAAYTRLINDNILNRAQKSLLLFTGSGLKDIDALQSWIPPVQARSTDEWKSIYKL